ncbi:MAG: ADP compounds hydrolase NudE [Gammaproteobacteria bacterium]|nr:MAG: ADP compounds hydrolase NudE [Gammaproteobacteria bacterium]
MAQLPKILDTKTIAKTRIFHVESLRLRFSNGVERDYERLVTSKQGAVMVIPMPDPESVLLIREYAAGVERYELAFPKGLIELGESPIEAANREMKEEVGYGAHNLTLLKQFSLAPGYLSHQMYLVLAKDLYEQRLEGDEPEEIEVVTWPIAKLDELVDQKDFTESRSIAALYLLQQYLRNLPSSATA